MPEYWNFPASNSLQPQMFLPTIKPGLTQYHNKAPNDLQLKNDQNNVIIIG